ncbi:MAG: cytochrome c biogenesis protein CcsA [Gemmatimonadetes bacterium]|nr:cytochrome c biogenesis protein CcsA [Gemmatimonadota bacterium]
MSISKLRRWGLILASLGILGILVLQALVFFWVPTEATQGIIQMIFYVHVPAAIVGLYVAFGILALTSVLYLWLGDDKLDQAGVAAAEGGMVFTTVVLLTGPLWGKIAWGTYWTWDPRLTLTLLLWFIYLGYFLVRASTQNPERGKRFAAVVGIVGALDIPLIHMSVLWFRSLHPGPVVMKPGSPTLAPQMLTTFMVGMFSFILLFLGLFALRFALEIASRTAATRARAAQT